jgi:spore coat protein JB
MISTTLSNRVLYSKNLIFLSRESKQEEEDAAVVDRYNNGRMGGRASCQNRACGCTDNSECKKMLAYLQKVEFSMIDVILYLDAYPASKEALCYYQKLKEERAKLIDALSEKCDMPITAFDNANTDKWVWTDSPWPWEPAAN